MKLFECNSFNTSSFLESLSSDPKPQCQPTPEISLPDLTKMDANDLAQFLLSACQRPMQSDTSIKATDRRKTKRTKDYCKVCRAPLPRYGSKVQGARRHILQFHMKKPIFKCSICTYTSNYDKGHVCAHVKRQHNGEGEVIVVPRSEHLEEENLWMKMCFGNETFCTEDGLIEESKEAISPSTSETSDDSHSDDIPSLTAKIEPVENPEIHSDIVKEKLQEEEESDELRDSPPVLYPFNRTPSPTNTMAAPSNVPDELSSALPVLSAPLPTGDSHAAQVHPMFHLFQHFLLAMAQNSQQQ